jgi:hypothetical protein
MTRTVLLATTAIIFMTGAAQAADAPQSDAGQRGVLVFNPDFFAAQRPNTALDMVNRVPGFSVDDGDGSARLRRRGRQHPDQRLARPPRTTPAPTSWAAPRPTRSSASS